MPRRAGQDTAQDQAAPEPTPGCQQADTCPAAGRGPWLRHVDKNGQRTTANNGKGTIWNRACPVQGCTIRVFG